MGDNPAVLDTNAGAEWDDIENDTVAPQNQQEIAMEGEQLPAYKVAVVLPSSLPEAQIRIRRMEAPWLQELELREGQAEEKLSELRMLLAWKSVSFRRGVREAEAYRARTRAWKDIQAIAQSARACARAYEQARQAIFRLSDSASDRGKALRLRFRKLTKEDFRISTEFIDPSMRGNRNVAQSWIWSMNVAQDIQDDQWLQECGSNATV